MSGHGRGMAGLPRLTARESRKKGQEQEQKNIERNHQRRKNLHRRQSGPHAITHLVSPPGRSVSWCSWQRWTSRCPSEGRTALRCSRQGHTNTKCDAGKAQLKAL